MSFLPYGRGGTGGWIGAFAASTLAHGGLIFGLLNFYGDFLDLADPEPEQAAFLVTLERLDADTLAGIIENQGVAGAEDTEENSEFSEDLSETDPEALEEVEPEPQVPETPEAEELEEIEPEVVEEVEPDIPEVAEEVEPIAPETIEAESIDTADIVGAESLTPEPIAPVAVEAEVLDAGPLIPETVVATGISPEDIDLQPILPNAPAPTALAPVVPSSSDVINTAPVAPPQTIAAVNNTPSPPPTSATPRPQATPRPPPSQQDLAIGDLITRIRGALADDCLIALPRRDGPDGIGLAITAAQDGAMEAFAQTALTAEDSHIRQTRTLVDPRQCPALTYIRQNQDYPATRMGLRVDQAELNSGEHLTGILRGASGRYILLLLIDDNGVVQDLQRFLSFSGNFVRFDVPVNRSGNARDTSQILLAIATRRPPDVIRNRAGNLAQEVFLGLDGELGPGASLAIATFDVR